MNEEQANEIFHEVIRGHWENWPGGNEELVVWVKALKPFDFATARDAINDFYTKWDSERYPKLPRILGAIRDYAKRHRRSGLLVKQFQIETEEGKPIWKAFWGNCETPRQELEPIAERLCKEADRMFPNEKHIANWFGPEKPEPEAYYGPDAKERAFDAILTGPDCPARRFLESYLDNKEQKQRVKARHQEIKERQQPVAIGEVLENLPF